MEELARHLEKQAQGIRGMASTLSSATQLLAKNGQDD